MYASVSVRAEEIRDTREAAAESTTVRERQRVQCTGGILSFIPQDLESCFVREQTVA